MREICKKKGINDEMKDMALPGFMMNDMMMNEMDHPQIKQENHNILPPEVAGSRHFAAAQVNSEQNLYHSNIPTFTISASPTQQSSMFMDQINPNSSIYQEADYSVWSLSYFFPNIYIVTLLFVFLSIIITK